MKKTDITNVNDNVTHLACEVKKLEGIITQTASASLIMDLVKLCELKKLHEDLAIRLILVTNSTLPNEWITPSGRAGRQIFEANGVEFRLWRILKALPLLTLIDEKELKLVMKKGLSVVITETIGFA